VNLLDTWCRGTCMCDKPIARPLMSQDERQMVMPGAGFELTIPSYARPKTFGSCRLSERFMVTELIQTPAWHGKEGGFTVLAFSGSGQTPIQSNLLGIFLLRASSSVREEFEAAKCGVWRYL
jgi:hypothetical protein